MGDLDLAEQNSCLESHLTICFAHFPPFLVAQMILVLFDSLHSPFLFQRLKCVSFFLLLLFWEYLVFEGKAVYREDYVFQCHLCG